MSDLANEPEEVRNAVERARPLYAKYKQAQAHLQAYAQLLEDLSHGDVKAEHLYEPSSYLICIFFEHRVDDLRCELEGALDDDGVGPVSRAVNYLQANE